MGNVQDTMGNEMKNEKLNEKCAMQNVQCAMSVIPKGLEPPTLRTGI